MITQEELKKVIHYDPESGVFTRLITTNAKAKVGDIAGSLCKGYRIIRVLKSRIKAHRLAFLYMTGEIPDQVDHINGIKDDNRWCNLRPANNYQNQLNKPLGRNSTSGHKGVMWNKSRSNWVVRFKVQGRLKYIGSYYELESAVESSKRAREKYHGEFANHG